MRVSSRALAHCSRSLLTLTAHALLPLTPLVPRPRPLPSHCPRPQSLASTPALSLPSHCPRPRSLADPYTNQLRPQLWRWGEFAFNLFFLIELLVNFYGLGFAFWRYNAAWNLFDLVVVSIGCLTMAEAFAPAFLPGSLSLIRNLRAFRIFRLFKRVKSLNKIIKSLVRAIPGVFHAFLIQIIVMCIYAIIGVDLFHMKGADGEYTTYNENVLRGVCTEEEVDDGLCSLNISVSSVTARGFTYGEEYFGTFFRALYTLFQVLTGESWAEAIARPAVMGTTQAIGPALFYVSFILICQIVLINVVVAVLLDKMVEDDGTPDKAQTMADKIRELLNERHGSLEDMFRGWDTNDTGSLSKSEFRDALFSMGYNGPSEVLDRLFTSISITGEIPFADLDRLVSMPTPRPKGSVKDEVFALRDELKSDLARIEADLACHRQWLEKQLLCMLNEVRADREPGVRPTTIHVGSAPPIPRSHGL